MSNKMMGAYSKFREHFGYRANFPNEVDFDQNEYADILEKCVSDNIDYTIAKYGTVPTYGTTPHDGVYID